MLAKCKFVNVSQFWQQLCSKLLLIIEFLNICFSTSQLKNTNLFHNYAYVFKLKGKFLTDTVNLVFRHTESKICFIKNMFT